MPLGASLGAGSPVPVTSLSPLLQGWLFTVSLGVGEQNTSLVIIQASRFPTKKGPMPPNSEIYSILISSLVIVLPCTYVRRTVARYSNIQRGFFAIVMQNWNGTHSSKPGVRGACAGCQPGQSWCPASGLLSLILCHAPYAPDSGCRLQLHARIRESEGASLRCYW